MAAGERLKLLMESQKGKPNGVAGLNESGKVPSGQLPAMDYVPTSRKVNGKALTADITLSAADTGAIPVAEKGATGGVATLDDSGKVPREQLPAMNYDPAGSAEAVQDNLNAHTNNKSNPHGVTAQQVGADPAGSASAVQGNLNTHTSNKNNPHGVTAAQVGTYEAEKIMASGIPAMFGLGAGAVPSDVLAYLGKYAQHWWKKRPIKYKAVITGTLQDVYMVNNGRQSDTGTVEFSDSIIASESDSHVVELVRPSSIELSYSNYRVANDEIKGKYFRGYIQFNNPGVIESGWTNVYYYPGSEDDVTRGGDAFKGYWVQCRAYATKTYKDYGDAVYVSSSLRNEYPDAGDVDGYFYEYIGIPFDNAVTAPKIATGSYVGTGTYGSSNPNSLTFGSIPKLVAVFSTESEGKTENTEGFVWISGVVGSESYNENKFTQSENTLSWYTDTVQNQLNNAGETYTYLALI